MNDAYRYAKITRDTKETEITAEFAINSGSAAAGTAESAAGVAGAAEATLAVGMTPTPPHIDSRITTGCGFLNHMLTLFAFHGGFSLTIDARGDEDVDYHHLTEDTGIVLGQCIKEAIGDGGGIKRYADVFLPMEEALVLIALDISGRTYLNYDVCIKTPKVGDFDTELAREFLMGLCRSLGLTLHVKLLYGENAHHIIEAIFKGLGRALGEAVSTDPARRGAIPSTKGSL